MKCSKCGSEMVKKSSDTVEIDECPSCFSIWFDADELREAKDEMDPDLNWMDFEIWKHKDQFKISDNAKTCPKCNVKMVTGQYGNTGIEVDSCHICKGIWLDKGEFEKIVEALADELLTMDSKSYYKAAFEEAKEIFAGSEGVISEWKDFVTVLRMMQYRIFTEKPEVAEAMLKMQKMNPIR